MVSLLLALSQHSQKQRAWKVMAKLKLEHYTWANIWKSFNYLEVIFWTVSVGPSWSLIQKPHSSSSTLQWMSPKATQICILIRLSFWRDLLKLTMALLHRYDTVMATSYIFLSLSVSVSLCVCFLMPNYTYAFVLFHCCLLSLLDTWWNFGCFGLIKISPDSTVLLNDL